MCQGEVGGGVSVEPADLLGSTLRAAKSVVGGRREGEGGVCNARSAEAWPGWSFPISRLLGVIPIVGAALGGLLATRVGEADHPGPGAQQHRVR